MKIDTYTKIVLTVIAIFVIAIWLQRRQPLQVMALVQAQGSPSTTPASALPIGFTAGKFATA